MSSVALTQFTDAAMKPSKRRTRCKNCMDWPDCPPESIIEAGDERIVVSGGWGPNSRHVTLCREHARIEAQRLEGLAREIRKSLRRSYGSNAR